MKLNEQERAVVDGKQEARRELPGHRLVRIIMALRDRVEALEAERDELRERLGLPARYSDQPTCEIHQLWPVEEVTAPDPDSEAKRRAS